MVSLGVIRGVVTQESAKELYEAAVFKKNADGDYQGAIQIFNEILKRFPEDKSIAAKAQLNIGTCYEKLGLKEALKAYQKVIENFPQQHEEVQAAKERVSLLSKALVEEPRKPKFRKIRIPSNPENGVLSPDGKRLAFVSQKSVWTVPIPGNVQPDLAGEPRRLTEPVGAWNKDNSMAWSGDGKWIAFNTRGENAEDGIYVVSSEGGLPKKIPVVPYLNRTGFYNYRISLSPKGQRLIFSSRDIESARLMEEKNPSFMYSIPTAGGNAERLTDTWAGELSFSPDGGKIAYASPDYWANDEAHQGLWLVNSDGTDPVRLADTPGIVRGPVWSPDGDLIAFNHDPRKMNSGEEIWIITLSKSGKASGAPVKIRLPFESHQIISGWTADNKMGLIIMKPIHHAIYTVPATGGKATQVTPDTPDCWASYPKWSLDGDTLYFRWEGGNIASVPSVGGEPRFVHSQENTGILECTPGAGNGLSPDGKKIVFSAYKKGSRPLEVSIWTVSVDGKDLTQVSKSPSQDRHPSWSPDGKFIAFSRYEPKANDEFEMNLYLIPSEGGEIRKLTSKPNRVAYASIDWSPDGKHIAYFSRDNTLNLLPAEGGEHRVLADVERVGGHSNLSWSPDGKELAYTSSGRLLVVAVEGGEPREVETGFLKEGVQDFHIDWSPDGKKFVFSAGFGGEYELWLMEDFLHLVKRPKL